MLRVYLGIFNFYKCETKLLSYERFFRVLNVLFSFQYVLYLFSNGRHVHLRMYMYRRNESITKNVISTGCSA